MRLCHGHRQRSTRRHRQKCECLAGCNITTQGRGCQNDRCDCYEVTLCLDEFDDAFTSTCSLSRRCLQQKPMCFGTTWTTAIRLTAILIIHSIRCSIDLTSTSLCSRTSSLLRWWRFGFSTRRTRRTRRRWLTTATRRRRARHTRHGGPRLRRADRSLIDGIEMGSMVVIRVRVVRRVRVGERRQKTWRKTAAL